MHNAAMLQRTANERLLTPEQLGRRSRSVWLIFAALAAVLIGTALYGAGIYGRLQAIAALEDQGQTDANLKVALLRAVLEGPRALPLLLADDQQVRDALASGQGEAVMGLDRKLQSLVAGTRASVLYVTGKNGIAIASSNWREPLSFVGNDYSFRDYFRRAMKRARRSISRLVMSATGRASIFPGGSGMLRLRLVSSSSRWSSISWNPTGAMRFGRPMLSTSTVSCSSPACRPGAL